MGSISLSQELRPVLKALFELREEVRIKRVGPCDAFGYAACILEDGTYITKAYPVEGEVGYTRFLEPQITECLDSHAWIVKPYMQPEFKVTMNEIAARMRATSCDMGALCELFYEKRDEALQRAKNGNKES